MGGVSAKRETDGIAEKTVEPLYSLAVATEMIPMPSITALRMFLFNHKEQFPGRYRRTRWYEQRFLALSEIKKIREMTFHGLGESRFASLAGRSGRRPSGMRNGEVKNGFFARIAAEANAK